MQIQSLLLTPNPPAPQGLKFMCEINRERERERETERERTHGVSQEAGEEKREKEKGGGEKRAGRQ